MFQIFKTMFQIFKTMFQIFKTMLQNFKTMLQNFKKMDFIVTKTPYLRVYKSQKKYQDFSSKIRLLKYSAF